MYEGFYYSSRFYDDLEGENDAGIILEAKGIYTVSDDGSEFSWILDRK